MRYCVQCGVGMPDARPDQRFHNAGCRLRAWRGNKGAGVDGVDPATVQTTAHVSRNVYESGRLENPPSLHTWQDLRTYDRCRRCGIVRSVGARARPDTECHPPARTPRALLRVMAEQASYRRRWL
jgi:hypothetical protein